MKISEITVGERYVDLGGGRFDLDDTEQVYLRGTPCTVVEKLPGGKVRVRGSVQGIAVSRLQPLQVLIDAEADVRRRREESSRRFDQRTVALEEARKRILAHLEGVDMTGMPYDLSADVLAQEVRPHNDRSGWWRGDRVTLDYIQIATLLDRVSGDPL